MSKLHGIILGTDKECTDLIALIDSKVKFMFKGASKNYTEFIRELNGERRLVIINPVDVQNVLAKYPDVLAGFGETLINSVEEVNIDEWISKEEF